MKHLKIAGLCLVAVFALGMVAAGSASALPAEPFFEQCQKVVEANSGTYTNEHCTTKKAQEPYSDVVGGDTECRETFGEKEGNWKTMNATTFACEGKTTNHEEANFIKVTPAIETFSSVSGPGKLLTVNGHEVTCEADTDSGQITGPKEVGVVFIKFTGCKEPSLGVPCSTAGAASGEIRTNELKGRLGYIVKSTKEIGLLLEPTAGSPNLFAEFKCTSIVTIKVKGAVIGRSEPVDKFSKTGELKYKQASGVQEPIEFENKEKGILETKISSGSYEQSGIKTEDTITFQDETQVIG
jgi:hypothetical protein